MTCVAPAAVASPTGRRRKVLRGDIQGMRAMAVLAVVASHAGIRHLAGGYVGVDVFFVISGYLITQQLLREVRRDGRVSIGAFYARRARRILPAATVVLAATVAFAAVELGVLQTRAIVKDAVWASFFGANIHFARVGTDYFAQDQAPSPLQHFWSLSVEEQFYLVWPLLILVCAVIAYRRRRSGSSFVPALAGLLAVIVVLSLAWSVWTTDRTATTAYFSTLARAWELGVGAGAAILTSRASFGLSRWSSQLLALTGLVLVVDAFMKFTGATLFPGYAALMPVLGSAALLVAGSAGRPTVVGRMLSLQPLRWIGDWSYSLYLWHYPLLMLPMLQAGHALSLTRRAELVLLAIALSAISYHLIENPVRRARTWKITWRAVALYPVSVALVGLCAACAVPYADHVLASRPQAAAIKVSGVPEAATPGTLTAKQLHTLLRASVRAALRNDPIPTSLNPSLEKLDDSVADLGACDYFATGTHNICPHGDLSSKRTVVVYGNSHGRHWIPALDQVAQRDHFKVYYLVMSQCTAALVTQDVLGGTAPFTRCVDFHSWAINEIQQLHPSLVIVSSNPVRSAIHLADGTRVLDSPEHDQLEYNGYTSLFAQLKPLAGRTVLIRDIPRVEINPSNCLPTKTRLGSCLSHQRPIQKQEANLQVRAAHATGVGVVSMDDFFCWKGWCPAVVGNTIVHRDSSHMTNEYSALLARPLGQRLGLDNGSLAGSGS